MSGHNDETGRLTHEPQNRGYGACRSYRAARIRWREKLEETGQGAGPTCLQGTDAQRWDRPPGLSACSVTDWQIVTLAALGLIFTIGMAGADIINRIAVIVGKNVIKQSDILREIRMTDFLNGDKLDFEATARRKAAERLIDQKAIRREMEAGQYPEAAAGEASQLLAQIKKERFGSSQQRYEQALKQYGIAEDGLQTHLRWQMTVLRFIDARFRPGVTVTGEQVEESYNKRLAELKAAKSEFADRDNLRQKVEQDLTGERVNEQFYAWLAEQRKQIEVEFHEEAFR